MKKFLVIPAALILVCILVFSGCGEEAEPTTTSPSATTPSQTSPTTTEPTTTTTEPTTMTTEPTTTTPAGGPEYGGTLRCVAGAIPNVLGYPPEKGPSDNFYMLPVIEHLCEWGDSEGNMIPVLAESWDADPDNLTFTWHLRQGVKFHDGTDWNAEALKWNFDMGIESGTLSDSQYIDSLEVIDEHTLKMNLNAFAWNMLESWGLLSPISPTAYENSGATEEERIAWARVNAVGTGAYTVSDWKRDEYIKFAKNPDYWQEGLPYLDAIEIYYIPDAMVASAKMEAGEADIWFAVSTVQNIKDLQSQGMKLNWGPGMFVGLLPDSNNPDSPLAIKEVREAIEYALDRPAIAELLGQGLYEPLNQMASANSPAYVEGYNPRPFNQDKARELLAQAGLSAGFTTKIMTMAGNTDAVAAIQSYLAEVGIIVEPDIADVGRYIDAAFISGFTDLLFAPSGINPSATDLFVHYGPNPMTFRTGDVYKSPEYLALCAEALDPSYTNAADAMDKIRAAIRQAGEDAMIIPLWRTAEACIMQTYVYSDYLLIHGIIWTPQDDWMAEH